MDGDEEGTPREGGIMEMVVGEVLLPRLQFLLLLRLLLLRLINFLKRNNLLRLLLFRLSIFLRHIIFLRCLLLHLMASRLM
jgi:hypothetical protein